MNEKLKQAEQIAKDHPPKEALEKLEALHQELLEAGDTETAKDLGWIEEGVVMELLNGKALS